MAGFTKFLNFSRLGAWAIIKAIIKHWYFMILILVLLPTIISSISLGINERNPAIPFIQLGTVLANADAQIAEDVETLKENPQELIGMSKPEKGIWQGIKYKWKVFWNVIMRELGLIWAIFFPFIIIYKVLRNRNISETAKNLWLTIAYGLTFIFVINLVMIVNGLVTGSLISNAVGDTNTYKTTWLIIIKALPFHGVLGLVGYLGSLLK